MDDMYATNESVADNRLKVLTVIASYGQKNIDYLQQLIRTYQGMQFDVHIVVVSDAPKNLGSDVEVVVGLPSANPWSLPFAHKPIFAKYLEHYDLFLYSEDDMGVTEENIWAFIRASAFLEEDEIAGFLRYEVDESGTWSFPEVHGSYHWKPESVRQRGEYIIAEFTNEHAAFYVLTQNQLRKAIASGGFLREPYEGRYDMLCTAATDPYTSCGLRKVICISALDQFLIHHLSNRYPGKFGISIAKFRPQVERLLAIAKGDHPGTSLLERENVSGLFNWSRNLYERPDQELVALIAGDTKRILSVGCGWGATEVEMMQGGATVTALPLDSVIAAAAAEAGVALIYGRLEECLSTLESKAFDCVLISNLLHLVSNPRRLLEECCRVMAPEGLILIAGPTSAFAQSLGERLFGWSASQLPYAKKDGNKLWMRPNFVRSQVSKFGLKLGCVHWLRGAGVRARLPILGRFSAVGWALQAWR